MERPKKERAPDRERATAPSTTAHGRDGHAGEDDSRATESSMAARSDWSIARFDGLRCAKGAFCRTTDKGRDRAGASRGES